MRAREYEESAIRAIKRIVDDLNAQKYTMGKLSKKTGVQVTSIRNLMKRVNEEGEARILKISFETTFSLLEFYESLYGDLKPIKEETDKISILL